MSQHNRYREEEKEEIVEENIHEQKPDLSDEEIKKELCKDRTEQVDSTETIQENSNSETEKMKLEMADLKDQLLRNRAELENFKKRMYDEKIKERKYAMNDFFQDIIDLIDIFNKAVSVNVEDENVMKFLKGFVMINTRLRQILEKYGVTEIDALNKPFDPNLHSAMETVKVDGVEKGMVVEVVITGYVYKDRVLRPSMVKVSE